MNRLTPYAAFFMRLAVGFVFFEHGLAKFHNGVPAVAGFAVTRTGGSGGKPRSQLLNLATQAVSAHYVAIVTEAYGVRGHPMALWFDLVC